VVVGSTQRFGISMGFGGPHAAYFATKEAYKRNIPGRLIGVSVDAMGNYALRMALQTREQHIRRDKASSNICTAQALLAIMAGFYAAYHGPAGLRNIASRIHHLTVLLDGALKQLGYDQHNATYFDTLRVELGELAGPLRAEALNNDINLYYEDHTAGIALDEETTYEDVVTLVRIFAKLKGRTLNDVDLTGLEATVTPCIPKTLQRTSGYLSHPVFNQYHSEHEMLRYIKALETKDLSLCHSMIPLGSCTMKLNATTEMAPLTWPQFSAIHPFAPADQIGGYMHIINEL